MGRAGHGRGIQRQLSSGCTPAVGHCPHGLLLEEIVRHVLNLIGNREIIVFMRATSSPARPTRLASLDRRWPGHREALD